MANPLATTIMNNISKKKINKISDIDNQSSIKNINEKEEEILKSILYKNKVKTTKQPIQDKSKKTSIKELSSKKESKDKELKSKDKVNKKIISLRDLAK